MVDHDNTMKETFWCNCITLHVNWALLTNRLFAGGEMLRGDLGFLRRRLSEKGCCEGPVAQRSKMTLLPGVFHQRENADDRMGYNPT